MATNEPVGVTPRRAPPLIVGRVVGLASVFVGSLMLLLWLAIRVHPALARRFALVPFFDGPLRLAYEKPYVTSLATTIERLAPMLIHLVIALLLIGVGVLVLRRHRLAPSAFLLSGWGGLVFAVSALWPGSQVRAKIEFGVSAARSQGVIPPDGGFLDLVPSQVFVAGIGFVVLWLALLIAGSWHLARQRDQYR